MVSKITDGIHIVILFSLFIFNINPYQLHKEFQMKKKIEEEELQEMTGAGRDPDAPGVAEDDGRDPD